MKKEKLIDAIIKDSKKTVLFLKKTPWFLGSNAFVFFLIILAVDFAIGGYLFYKYLYLPEKQDPVMIYSKTIFNEKNYQTVLEYWQKRQESFDSLEFQQIKNPFK